VEYALIHAQKWREGLPTVYLPYVALAATYGQLERPGEAASTVSQLLKVKPDFLSTARREFNKLNLEPELTDNLLQGLQKE